MSTVDPYCKVYVAEAPDVASLLGLVAQVSGGAVQVSTVATTVMAVRVAAESRHLPLTDDGDDFVRWRHYLEIDAADEHVAFDAFLAAAAHLLNGLRAHGLRTVAACDFESQLAAAMTAH
jgi:hypothetical protein